MTKYDNQTALTRRSAIGLGMAASVVPIRAFAQGTGSPVAPPVQDGSMQLLRDAWQAYNAAVENARLALENTERFRNRPASRATAYTSLAEAQAMAYNFAIAPRMDHPVINTRSWYHNVHTLGGTSSDLYHVTSVVDGRHTYRLHGRVGDMKVLVMQIFKTVFVGTGQKQIINADLAKMADANGKFEVILSSTPQKGNWLPLDPESDMNMLFIRRFFDNWQGDRGELDIELLDGPIIQDDTDPAATARRIRIAADALTFLVQRWNIGIYDIYLSKNGGRKNRVAVVPGETIASESAGSPNTIYTWGIFDLKEDEALIIEYPRPDAAFWSIQVQDVWTKPINYIDRQSDINGRNAAIDDDGKFRAVIAHQDPGVANWLDTGGHQEGTIVGRAYLANSTPAQPTVTLVKAREIKKHLPMDTTYVSPDQRSSALKLRRDGILRMFGDE